MKPASEIKELANANLDKIVPIEVKELLENISKHVEFAAKRGKYFVNIRQTMLPRELYYFNEKSIQKVVDTLKELGYDVLNQTDTGFTVQWV